CGETFDVIYVDGDHRALGAYTDCVLAWPLLAPDGIMIIDDYGFMPDLPKDKRPQAGVDRFLETIPRAVRRAAPGVSACLPHTDRRHPNGPPQASPRPR